MSAQVAWEVRVKRGTGVYSRKPAFVVFMVDGRLLRKDRVAPYAVRWDTTRVQDGRHMLTVRAEWRTSTRSPLRMLTASGERTLSSGVKAGWAKRRVKVENEPSEPDAPAPSEPAPQEPVPQDPAPAPEPTPESAPDSPAFPASYLTGPLGANNILPPRTGAFLGILAQGTWAERQNQIASREQFIGRRLDFVHIHYGAPIDACYSGAPFSQGREQWVVDRGSLPIISWTHGWTLDAVNSGLADECLRDVGRRFAAWGKPILLRTYWEFNGSWFRWSGTGTKFISAWKRTVDVMRSAGATNVGFVWCPDEGNFAGTNESYPGDNYVDWVCSDRYNWNKSTAFCRGLDGTWHAGWCEFEESFRDGSSIEELFGPRKPYMVAETGTVEDPSVPGRKGEWHRNARDAIKARFPHLKAYIYFDVDLSVTQGANWRLDTTGSSLAGFRDLALDPHFNTR